MGDEDKALALANNGVPQCDHNGLPDTGTFHPHTLPIWTGPHRFILIGHRAECALYLLYTATLAHLCTFLPSVSQSEITLNVRLHVHSPSIPKVKAHRVQCALSS